MLFDLLSNEDAGYEVDILSIIWRDREEQESFGKPVPFVGAAFKRGDELKRRRQRRRFLLRQIAGSAVSGREISPSSAAARDPSIYTLKAVALLLTAPSLPWKDRKPQG